MRADSSIVSGTEPAAGPDCAAALSGDPAPRRGRRSLRTVLWGGAVFLLGGVLGAIAILLSLPPAADPPPIMHFITPLPSKAPLAATARPLAFSPDGRRLACVAQVEGETMLYIRDMEKNEARPIPGTEGAVSPFFSPDGAWIGYFDTRDSKLKKIPSSGGKPFVLGPAQFGPGACWGEDDSIIYAPDLYSGLWRLPASGGTPEEVTRLRDQETAHRWPEILPGGKAMIFTVATAGSPRLTAYSFATGDRKLLLDDASDGRYSPSGHLVFMRGRDLMAVPFDPLRLEIGGTPVVVRQGLETDKAVGAGHFAFSSRGLLAYTTRNPEEDFRTLLWADRQGGMERLVVSRGAFSYPRVSPDGSRLAVVIHAQDGQANIWILDIATGSFTRLTTQGNCILPLWAPDGQRLVFASDLPGFWSLYWMPSDGSGPAEVLHRAENPEVPNSWSADGRLLLYTEFAPKTGADIWTLSMTQGRRAEPYLQTASAEWGGAFSPDGRWVAYTSDQSGPDQVYVRPFPGPGDGYQVSTAEGREPIWGRDGKELFFRYFKGLMSVGIQEDSEFSTDAPRILVPGDYETGEMPAFPNYDVSLDGRRFVLIPRGENGKREIEFDLNWTSQLAPQRPSLIEKLRTWSQ